MKILIIEDNDDLNQIITSLFTKEHEVVSAFSGTEGLLLFKEDSFDLVLLDIMLPGKSGKEVLAEIREINETPVIIITALSDKALVSEYLLNGANDYITKPFDLDEVVARAAVWLRLKIPQTKAIQNHYKNITLNAELFSISNAKAEIRLSKKEFEILNLLIQNPNKIFTKENLFETVWGETYFSGDNTLNTHLSNLRKKIASLDGSEEYIETIWGLGVRLKKENEK